MKKNPFLILILLLFSFVTNVTAANAPKDDVSGPFVIKYTDAFGDEHTEYAATIQDAFDPSILLESIDKDKEIKITLNSSFMDAMNPYTIVIENGLKYNFTNRESSGCSLLCIVDITIQDGGSLAINGQVDFERFPTFNFFLGCITVKASNPKSKLTIDGGYFVGIYNKPVLINEGFSSPLNTDVKIKHASFHASDGISVIKSRNFGLLADGCKFYELDAEGKETGVGLGENYYSSERFLAYASHEPVSAVVVREADKVFELSYTDISDDQHIEHYATMVDAVYTVGEEDKNVTITLIDDCINDDSFFDEISLGSCSAITYDFVSKGKKLIGGKYLFSATYHDGLTIFGDNTNTDIKATFNLGEGGGMIINGGRYSSRGSDDLFSIDVGSITITSGRFNSPEKGIWNNRKQIHLGSGKSYYEITYSDGEEKETKLDEKYDDNDHLINASDEIVKEVIVRGPITPYAELSSDGKTLTFKYDGFMPETNAWKVNEYIDIDKTLGWRPEWTKSPNCNFTTVVFDKSFSDYSPTSCFSWFDNCRQFTTIEGIHNLVTNQVKDMSNMFAQSTSLKSIDLSGFITSQVEDMRNMFESCWEFENLDLSSFNTSKVEKIGFMLADCSKLKVVKFGPDFKPASFIEGFFQNSKALETIIVDKSLPSMTFHLSDDYIFELCESLVGGNGTKFDAANENNPDYFHIDGKDGLPGYLTTLPYTIQFEDAGDEYQSLTYYPFDNSISLPEYNYSSTTVVIPDAKKEGYRFLGWTLKQSDGTYTITPITDLSIDPTADRYNRVYKANWEKTYSVTLPAHMVMVKDDGVYNTVIQPEADGKYYFTSGEDAVFKVPDGYRFLPSTGYQCYTATEMKKEPNERSQYGMTGNVKNTNNVFGATLQNDDLVVLAEIRKIVDITVETPFEYVYGSFTDPVIKKDGVALTESEYNNVTYSVKLKSDYALALAEYSKEVLSQFSVDEYQLIATYTSDDELDAKGAITKDGEFGQSDIIDFKITPKPITAQVEGTFKKPYDGNNTLPTATSADGSTTVPTITINKNDIVGDDEVSVSIVTDDPDYPYEFPEIDIDSYTIHLKLQLSGKDAYNYTLANVITEGGVKKTGFIEMDVTITKSKSSKPTNVSFVNGTICGKPDCSITGVTSAMEYSNDGGKTYTSITSTEITGLAAGTYLVRMAGNDTYIASDPVEGTLVNGSDQLKVTYNFNEESLQNKNTSVGVCFNESVTEPTNIPQYEGYKLVGWYSDKECSKANKYSFDTKVTDNITLYAKWVNEKDIIAIEFNGNVIYPTNTNDFCKGKDNTILLPYTITNGAPSDYKITFDSNLFSIIEGEVSEDHIINIPVPQNIVTGEYTGTIEFSNSSIDVSTTYPVKITATIPLRNVAVQLYTDMLIVDNHEGIYNAYQWYRNGEALSGATLLYYTEPKFDYNSLYTVKLSGDGKEMMSCPVEWLSTAKALKPSIKVYPNPAKQNENFTLEILDFDEDQNYDIVIFTANGTMVKKISNVEQKTSVTLPSGVYSGSLINGGEKKGFKLIVK